MDGIGRAQGAAIKGIQRAGEMMNRAAQQVAHASVGAPRSAAARVNISPEARQLAQEGANTESDGDITQALVDTTVAKHLNAANVKVLQTADESERELLKSKR